MEEDMKLGITGLAGSGRHTLFALLTNSDAAAALDRSVPGTGTLPDQRLGEIVGAAVVLRDGVELTTEELTAYLADHLAAFKIPAHIWFRGEQLPRIASGKIFKRQLKSDYSAQLEQQLQDV